MDNHLDETTAFEVTVTTDGVSTSGISESPHIVLDTNSTLSWGINECSSSFQSVSSCETLESNEHNAFSTESPQVIIVPFLADNVNEITETVVASDGVDIPMMKECSIRIDPLKMSSEHCDEMNVEKIIELPFTTNCATDCSTKPQPCYLTDDDSCGFEGFAVESTLGTEFELYKNAASSIQKDAARVETKQDSSEPILTERILTERHLTERSQPERKQSEIPPPERNIKLDMMIRPRQQKVAIPQLADKKIEPINQSRIQNIEINVPTNTENSTVKPVPIPARVSSTPVENVEMWNNKQDSSSDLSDNDNNVPPKAAVDNPATEQVVSLNTEIKNKQRELKRLEKLNRKKNLDMIAGRIKENWNEFFDKVKRIERKKEMAMIKYKTNQTKGDSQYRHRGHGEKVSCLSDSDSDSTGSSTSKTSGLPSSSDSDSKESNNSTHLSDTSHASHTKTESDSTDTDSSDTHHSSRQSFNSSTRSARSSSDSTDTSETTSSDDRFDKERRNYHLLKKTIYRKQYRSNGKSEGNCLTLRKRRASESYRPGESLRKRKKMAKELHRSHNDSKRTKNRYNFGQKRPILDVPSRSATVKSALLESTSAGDFAVQQYCFD